MDYKKITTTASVIVLVILLTAGLYTGTRKILGEAEDGKYADIDIQGPIRSGRMVNTVTVNPEQFEKLVSRAKDDRMDGFMFRINSPGGSVVTSKRVAGIIEDIEKPVACVLEDVAASGAYWAATECDRIYADSLTMAGSIGATSAYLEFTGAMEEYGLEYVNLTAGKFKDAGTPFKNITDEEKKMFKKQLETVHQEFKQQVAEERNLPMEKVDNLSTGRVYLGRRAVELGLVDEIGHEEEAEEFLENRTGKELSPKEYSQEQEFSILSMLAAEVGKGIGSSIMTNIEAESLQKVRFR